MAIIYPTTITDGTGRVWTWSDSWDGYRAPGMMTHGYDTIKKQWGILADMLAAVQQKLEAAAEVYNSGQHTDSRKARDKVKRLAHQKVALVELARTAA